MYRSTPIAAYNLSPSFQIQGLTFRPGSTVSDGTLVFTYTDGDDDRRIQLGKRLVAFIVQRILKSKYPPSNVVDYNFASGS